MRILRQSTVLLGAVALSLAVMTFPATGHSSGASILDPVDSGQQRDTRLTGKIAFAQRGDVYVMRATGRRVRRLSDGRTRITELTWSPDGRRIAYLEAKGNVANGYVIDVAGQRVSRAVGAVSMEWSPDGRRIAYTTRVRQSGIQLFVMNADGSGRRQVTTVAGGVMSPAEWSPDGRRIAYAALGTNDVVQVFVMAADGSQQRQVTTLPEGEGVGALGPWRYLAWSPDGQWIASVSLADSVFVVKPDGSSFRRLASGDEGSIEGPTWSPDGRRLGWGEAGWLKAITLRTGKVSRLRSPTSGDQGPPVWSPDGRRIVFRVDNDGSWFLFLMRSDFTGLRPFPRRTGFSSWSPDGRHILFANPDVTVMNANFGQLQTLARVEGRSWAGPVWFAAVKTRTTMSASPQPVTKGAQLTLTGKITKVGVAVPGATVMLRFKAKGAARFTTVATTTTGPTGRYTARVTARKTGTWKAFHPRTAATLSSSTSEKVTVQR